MATTVPEITDANTFADKVTDAPAPPGEEGTHFRSVDLNALKARLAEQALAINANVLAPTRVVIGADTPSNDDAGKLLVSVGGVFSLDAAVATGTAFRILVADASGMSISGSGGASVSTSIGLFNDGDLLLVWKSAAAEWNLVYLHDQGATVHRATGGNPHATAANEITAGTLADARLPTRLGNGASVTAADADNAIDDGWWRFNGSTANSPVASQFFVVLVSTWGNYIRQVAYRTETGETYERYRTSGLTWSAWRRIDSPPDFDIDGGTATEVLRLRGDTYAGVAPPRGLVNRETNAFAVLRVSVDITGNTATIVHGHNIASATWVADNRVDVLFHNAHSSTNYAVVAGASNSGADLFCSSLAASGFTLWYGGGTPGANWVGHVVVLGRDLT